MNIPVAKPYLTTEEAQAAYDTILSGWITQGPRVAEFEEKFAQYAGAKYAVAVSNCTTALHLSMIVAGIGPGDEVICPSMSYIATANAIRYVGAKVVFAEINPETYNLDIADVAHRITPRTKAILLVHQMGLPADIEAYKELCALNHLSLIEDAACAAGSAYKGQKIGSHSELVCFSFHPRKVISTGDGGMVTTNNKDYYERLKLLRQHGMAVNDRVRHKSNKVIITDHMELGYNYRLTDVQAAMGIKQLEKLDWIVAERRKIGHYYTEALKDIKEIRLPKDTDDTYFNYQSYSIYLLPKSGLDRNTLMQKMLDAGISTRSGIMTAHRETAYKDYSQGLRLPVSEDACDRSIILPLYIPMGEDEKVKVVSVLRQALKES